MVSSAARVGSINVLLQVQMGQASAGLNKFAGDVEHAGVRTQRAVGGIDRSLLGVNRSMGSLNTRGLTGVTVAALRANTALDQMRGLALAAGVAVGGLVPAALGASMIRVVDGAHRLSNQLRTVTENSADLKNTQDALYDVAQRTRSAFDSTVTIYARTARATEHLGLSQQKLLRITETVQKAFAVGGASAAEAQGAAIQLSQGIASNRFSGEEFRSVAENAPVLLRGMAESLGVNIGKLREMAHAGELTADVVTKAILDASATIDADFAKTTSTIEQAWVRVGNAATKYAMDSKQASAGSQAIVGGLNLMADNVSGLVDLVVALGAALVATYAGRGLNAIRQNIAATSSHLHLSQQAAAATLQHAQAEAAANAQRLASAKAYYAMVTQGAASESTRVKAARELHSANIANNAAQKQLVLSTQGYDAALKAATVSGRGFAAAGRLASGAWAFIGGPFGAALLAISGIMYIQSQRAAEASERSDRYADAIEKAGEKSTGASPGIKQVAQDLFSVGAGATAAERAVSLMDARAREAAGLKSLATNLEALQWSLYFSTRTMPAALVPLIEQFRAGTISAEQFADETDRIAQARPDLTTYIADMQRVARETDAARGEVAGVEEQIEKLDGKEAKVTITIGTRTMSLDDLGVGTKGNRLYPSDEESQRKAAMERAAEDMRQNMLMLGRSGWDELFKFPKDKKTGGGRSRRSAEDRFDNSVQAVYDRIEALRLEREMLGASFYEQTRREEALKLEQEALKQVREEARRKGDADWQNAQISKEKRAEIKKVTEELAREADATRRATEAMELNRDILKDVMSGMREALADGKITWEEVGDVAIRVLDKIINKIEDELIESIFNMNQAGASGGGGGGGILGFIGGLLGFGGGIKLPATAPIPTPRPIMDSGGAMLASGLVSFGPKTRMLQADSGFGPRNFMAVLEEGESVLTDNLMDRTMGALSAATDKLKEGGRAADHSVLEVALSPDLIAKVLQQAGNQAVKIVRGNDRARKNIYDNGGNPP